MKTMEIYLRAKSLFEEEKKTQTRHPHYTPTLTKKYDQAGNRTRVKATTMLYTNHYTT